MQNRQMQVYCLQYIIQVVSTIVKILFFLVLIIAGYYFFSKLLITKEKDLAFHYSNLVQNKIAYINLAKINPKDPSFGIQKSNLIGIVKETNKKGLENPINSSEKEIFTRQNVILEKVYSTKSYEEGISILKSPESVKLLSDQTVLIEELKKSPVLRLDWR